MLQRRKTNAWVLSHHCCTVDFCSQNNMFVRFHYVLLNFNLTICIFQCVDGRRMRECTPGWSSLRDSACYPPLPASQSSISSLSIARASYIYPAHTRPLDIVAELSSWTTSSTNSHGVRHINLISAEVTPTARLTLITKQFSR